MSPINDSEAVPQQKLPATSKADCLECKIIGTVTCWGVSAYSFLQRSMIPQRNVFNRRWMAGFGAFWVLAGAARAIV